MTRVLMVAATRSGAGKTTITLGLLRAFRRRGLRVRAAKAGPDYIDPAFHAAATGLPSVNLDSWAMPPAVLDRLFEKTCAGADLLIIEAAMGLFDGVDGEPGSRGSAADLAARFSIPVALVLDISGQAQTVGAVALGFVHFDPAVTIAGVIANRVASVRHHGLAERAVAAIGLPLLGGLGRDAVPPLPSRHLGLVQAREHGDLDAILDRLADAIERDMDLDAILEASRPVPSAALGAHSPVLPPPGQRIALARDDAFSFTYPHLLSDWRDAGAEISLFSPLADEAPPPGCDVCWLPGGYPELHAGRLAAASGFLAGLRAFAVSHPVHGECGGYMVLGASIEDASGRSHLMAGLLDHRTSFARRSLSLGYRTATMEADGVLGPKGAVVRGHEFHYATTIPGADAALALLADGQGRSLGPAGGRRGGVSGSFFHAIAAGPLHPEGGDGAPRVYAGATDKNAD